MYGTPEEGEARFSAVFGTRTRFVMMALVLLCLASIWSNILTFNFAVICMSPEDGNETEAGNGTSLVGESPLNGSLVDNVSLIHQADRYSFTKIDQSWITAIVAIAALISNFPVVMVVNVVGIRTVFTVLGLLSSLATLLLPTAIRLGFPFLLGARFLQGIAFAANFPVIGAFCSRWSYFKQIGLFSSALVAYVQLSPAITMPVSGGLCTALGWQSVFYFHGAVTVVLFVVYGLFYRNSPNKHPFVGRTEWSKISRNKPVSVKKGTHELPFSAILRTPAVWAVWVAGFGNFLAVNMLFLFSPIYFSKVLGFNTHSTGISSALAPFAQFLVKVLCGAVSDRLHCLAEVNKFRLFNSFSFFISALCFIILSFLGTKNTTINWLLVGAAAGALGATTGGFFKVGPVISKQYSYFVTGNISILITVTMIIVPFLVTALTPNNTQEEWRWVFLIVAAVQIVTNIFFVIFVRGEPCEWTEHDWKEASARVGDVSTGKGVAVMEL